MNGDSELFLKFALQRLKESFIGFHFATRKFPIALIGLSEGSLTHQKTLLRIE
jgi:hypothetical protein